MSPVKSRAVRFHDYGEPLDVLRADDIEVADPGARRVRVSVSAAGLNPADWELCRGFMPGDLPRGIGYDVAGTVDAVGDEVDDVKPGDLVFGTADFVGQPSSGVADSAILDSWYRVPSGLDHVEAAVLPMAVQTAKWTLDIIDSEPGGTVLVNGAGAMVGFTAVQIALRQGQRVVATAGPSFAEELRGMGAEVVEYGDGLAERVADLAGDPVTDVFDAPPPSAGSIAGLIPVVGDPGRVVTISNQDEARRLGARVNVDHMDGAAPAASFVPDYAALAAEGAFRIPIARTFPLADWRDAVELSMSGHPHGKVVLLPGS